MTGVQPQALSQASSEVIDPRETDLAHRNGYTPFPDTLIISTERSGLNLIRHAVEYSAKRRTPGKTHLLTTGPLAFHRTHRVNTDMTSPGCTTVHNPDGSARYKKAILLLRDPREILPRACNFNLNSMGFYCDNIEAFDRFAGEKLLIAYDDLIVDDSTFEAIFSFLGLSDSFVLSGVPEIRATSVAWYEENQKKGGGSQTKGAPSALIFHQKALSPEQLDELKRFLQERLGCLSNTYLSRWIG